MNERAAVGRYLLLLEARARRKRNKLPKTKPMFVGSMAWRAHSAKTNKPRRKQHPPAVI